MAKLLEKINAQGDESVIYPDVQSSLNHLAAYKKNGRIFGCSVSLSGTSVMMTAGILVLYGYRVLIESYETVIDLSSATPPSSAAKYAGYLMITRSGHDISHSFVFYSSSTSVSNRDISTTNGSAHLKICEFTFGPGGISNFVDALATIAPPTSSGGGEGGGIGKEIPAPRITVIGDRGAPYWGRIVVANKSDYSGYATKYSVKFQLVRYIRQGGGRKKNNGSKTYHSYTGWVYPAERVGRVADVIDGPDRKLPVSFGYGELVTFAYGKNNSESDPWAPTRTDGLIRVSDLCRILFKVGPNGTPGVWSENTCAKDLVCVRSKKSAKVENGVVGRHGRCARRHNFFKFALEARLYDGSRLVARSPIGNAIVVLPNMAFGGDGACGNVAKLFRIIVE